MEEVDLKDLFLYFLKRISIILAVSFLFLLVGVVYTLVIKTPMYRGYTTLILTKKEDGTSQTALTQSDITLNQKLVSTYSEIIKSKRVLKQVIDQLNLTYSASKLNKKISVSSVNDTEIIKIAVSDADAEKAAQIANTVASVFRDEVVNFYHLENVNILDQAEIENNPYNIKVFKIAVLSFAAGIAVSIMLLIVTYYFDNSIKSAEEIEKKLGIAVIGNIPVVGRKNK